MQSITLTRPDDLHLHLRDGALLRAVVPATVRRFARAIVMPNLSPPIVTTAEALAYRERILACLPDGARFEPLMTLYLSPDLSPEEIDRASESAHVHAVKLYPRGATTGSQAGVEGVESIYPVLERMEARDLPLLVHAETTRPDCDVFDRERVFLDDTLTGVVDRFPGLRIVVEHVTTREGVDFVREKTGRLAATITPQHLLLNRNALFEGGLRPHHYCLPVLKAEDHRRAVLAAAISGDPRFFLGTDSAPHTRDTKECDAGCAGIFSAPTALELYASAFAAEGALEKLEPFASHFGADFYGLPRNRDTIRLEEVPGDEDGASAGEPSQVQVEGESEGEGGARTLVVFRPRVGTRFRLIED